MIQQMTNRQLAQEINARIGNAPIPFDSVYSIALQIYQELGGEENDFDSVYSILLEILPLAESVANRTSISEVDELPDAYDNNNIYRLSSDDKVYMSKHVSTEYTNKLPDEQQIDKAILYEDEESIYYYKGAWKIICSDGEVEGYGWLEYTTPEQWYLVITQDNAIKITNDTKCFSFSYDDNAENVDFDAHTVTIDESTSNYQWDEADSLIGYGITNVLPAIYNAPEAAQIGNACFQSDSETLVYTGEETTIEVGGSETTVYIWQSRDSEWQLYSTKLASNIFFTVNGTNILSDTIFYDGDGEIFDDFSNGYLYIPQLNAPDSEQIGKAIGNDYVYIGEKQVHCSDGDVTVYYWGTLGNTRKTAMTLKPASDAYYYSYSDESIVLEGVYGNEYNDDIERMNWSNFSTLTYNGTVSGFNTDFNSHSNDVFIENLVKYQRAIENWEWKQIPTMDDVTPKVIKLEDIGATEMAKLNGFTENRVYNDVDIQVKIEGFYYPGILSVNAYNSGNGTAYTQMIKIFGYFPSFKYEEWVIQRIGNTSSWDAATIFMLVYNDD